MKLAVFMIDGGGQRLVAMVVSYLVKRADKMRYFRYINLKLSALCHYVGLITVILKESALIKVSCLHLEQYIGKILISAFTKLFEILYTLNTDCCFCYSLRLLNLLTS